MAKRATNKPARKKGVVKRSGQAKSASPHAPRLGQLRERMEDWQVDALLVSNSVDIRYLAGFVGDDSWLLVGKSGKPIILSDRRFEEQIQREAPQAKEIMRTKSLAETACQVVDKRGWSSLALQSDYLTITQRKQLAKHIGASRLKDVDDGLFDQRAFKTDDEIKLIQKAGKIQQQALRALLEQLKPGMSEFEAAGLLEYEMRRLGADGPSFPTIMAADANAALPHAIPGKSKLRKGGIVLIDWGARYQGYCSDMTRVFAFGNMKPKLREIYQVVLDAQLAAIEAIRPGVEMAEVDKIARDIITKAGYGKEFSHSLGHGIGLDIHEQPRLAASIKGALQTGQIVTVEPGIYLPGIGGVRIEDDILVTDKGHRNLTTDLPKSLDSAIL